MKTRYYSEESRLKYYRTTEDNEGLLADLLQVGCLQRIANALEKMAVNYDAMRQKAECYERWYEDERASKQRSYRQNTALRGVITKLKKRITNGD